MKTQLEQFVTQLIASETYDDDEGAWKFPDGSDCGTCTSAATLVAKEFNGSVVGFHSSNNPTALIGRHCAGHDFAIIDNRWIVDYWAFRYAEIIDRAVFDLETEDDATAAALLYGPGENWVPIQELWCGSARRSLAKEGHPCLHPPGSARPGTRISRSTSRSHLDRGRQAPTQGRPDMSVWPSPLSPCRFPAQRDQLTEMLPGPSSRTEH